jgi:hypothetical protein
MRLVFWVAFLIAVFLWLASNAARGAEEFPLEDSCTMHATDYYAGCQQGSVRDSGQGGQRHARVSGGADLMHGHAHGLLFLLRTCRRVLRGLAGSERPAVFAAAKGAAVASDDGNTRTSARHAVVGSGWSCSADRAPQVRIETGTTCEGAKRPSFLSRDNWGLRSAGLD